MAKIYIIEDDPDLRLYYKKVLEYYNHIVLDSADNGHDAIEKYRSFLEKPELILLDYLMPKKNGIEVLKEILKLNKNAKVIMITGNRDIKKIALNLGAVGFLEKPFSQRNLNKMIKKYAP